MFCILQASSRHKTDKHETMRKEEEKVKKKVNKLLSMNLLTNKLQTVSSHLITSEGGAAK